MAGSDVIKRSDVIEDNIFGPTIEEAEKALESINLLELGFKNLLRTTGKELKLISPESVAEAEQVAELVQRVNELEKQLIETKKKKAIGEEKLKQLRTQEAIDLAKINEQIKEQNRLNKEAARDQIGLTGAYQKASKELNDMRNAYKDLAIAGKENSDVAKELLKNIQAQDEKLKQIDATVGQHQRNVGNYTGALKGAGGALLNLGKLFGLNNDALHSLEQTYKKVIKVFKGTKETMSSLAGSITANNTATKQNTQETEKLSSAQKVMAKVTGESTGAMKALKIALAATGIGVALYLIYEAASAMGLFSSKTEETIDHTEELKDAVNELKNALDELAVQELRNAARILAAQLAAHGKSIDLTKKLSDAEKAVIQEQLKINKQKMEENIQLQEQMYSKLGQVVTNQIDKTKSSYAVMTTEHRKELQNTSQNLTKQQREELELQLLELKKQNVLIEQEDKNLKTELIINEINTGKEISDIKKDYWEKEKKRIEDELEFRKKMEDDYFAHIQKILKEVEEEEKKRRQKLRDDSTKDFWDARKERDRIVKDAEKERWDNEKKNLNDFLTLEKELQDSILKGFEDRIEKQKDLLDQQLSDIDSNIEQQRQLAARGLDNTLAFEEKRRAEALAKKAELDKKAARMKEASDLAEIFMEYVKAEIQNGSSTANARAFALTFITKGITKAIAGSAYEGVSDTGSGGNLDNKGGQLWMLHPHEGVVKRESNEKYPGLVEATNEGRAFDWFMMQRDDLIRPVLSDISIKKQAEASLAVVLREEMKSLRKEVRESGNKLTGDDLGNIIETNFDNGIKRVIHKKKRFC